ncbi:MAG: trehalase family glycosidase, partial [Bacteroidota bacterium]
MHYRILLFLAFVTFACERAPESPAVVDDTPVPTKDRRAPDELFGELFRRVQMERVFTDGKTFVDMIPKAAAEEIMTAYAAEKNQAGFNLQAFVEKYFSPPAQPESGFSGNAERDISTHINTLWPYLTRKAGTDEGAAGSLIPLPNDYVVPGGRFREVYYWDSYFTLLGLQVSGKHDLVRAMVENFAYLI